MTIKDLAAMTGYAVGTVSRALNDHPNVSEKARQVILQTAREQGFQLNVNAKQLKQSTSNTILVIVKGTGNEFFAEMLESIQNLVSKTRYQLVVDYLDEYSNEVIRAVQLCREKKPVGILFLGGNAENFANDFDKIDIPCVEVTNDASALNFHNLSSVTTNDREAGRCAIDTLAAAGHKKIAVIGGDKTSSEISRLRYEGCLTAMQAHGIDFHPETDYLGVRFSCEEGYLATRALLQKNRDFTAIFAFSDVMAIGAVRALWEAGKRVPEDVSVIGLDGLAIGSYMIPQLSTIRQDFQTIALRSVAILLRHIEDGTAAVHETVPHKLHLRESIRSIAD